MASLNMSLGDSEPEHGTVAVHMEHVTFLDRVTGSMDPETGQLYSYDPWVCRGTVSWGFGGMCHVVGEVSAPLPQEAVVNHPLRPTTAGHPDHQRAAHSAHSYLALDTVRWQKWNLDRISSSGNGKLGT